MNRIGIDSTYCGKIRERRVELKLSMDDLAEKLEVTQGFISKIENGQQKSIDKDLFLKWGRALGYDAHYWPARIVLRNKI